MCEKGCFVCHGQRPKGVDLCDHRYLCSFCESLQAEIIKYDIECKLCKEKKTEPEPDYCKQFVDVLKNDVKECRQFFIDNPGWPGIAACTFLVTAVVIAAFFSVSVGQNVQALQRDLAEYKDMFKDLVRTHKDSELRLGVHLGELGRRLERLETFRQKLIEE